MLKLGLRISRKVLEKRLLDEWEKNPARFFKAMNKAIAEEENKKARMAAVHRITQKVCRDMYTADPAGFIWAVRKGLSPCFQIGETVAYGEKDGIMRKAVIASMVNKGAFLIDSGVGHLVPGSQIHKLKKMA